jgi:hypothetical protein
MRRQPREWMVFCDKCGQKCLGRDTYRMTVKTPYSSRVYHSYFCVKCWEKEKQLPVEDGIIDKENVE